MNAAPIYPFGWPGAKPSRTNRRQKRGWQRKKSTGLTGSTGAAQTGKTTSVIGKTAPHKPCGIFVSSVQCSGLLPRHQGQGTTPVSRIGGHRFTRRNKPKVRLGTNKPGRMTAVVAADARLPIPMGGGFGSISSTTEQLTMTTQTQSQATPTTDSAEALAELVRILPAITMKMRRIDALLSASVENMVSQRIPQDFTNEERETINRATILMDLAETVAFELAKHADELDGAWMRLDMAEGGDPK
jgi:hypothetical protein